MKNDYRNKTILFIYMENISNHLIFGFSLFFSLQLVYSRSLRPSCVWFILSPSLGQCRDCKAMNLVLVNNIFFLWFSMLISLMFSGKPFSYLNKEGINNLQGPISFWFFPADVSLDSKESFGIFKIAHRKNWHRSSALGLQQNLS